MSYQEIRRDAVRAFVKMANAEADVVIKTAAGANWAQISNFLQNASKVIRGEGGGGQAMHEGWRLLKNLREMLAGIAPSAYQRQFRQGTAPLDAALNRARIMGMKPGQIQSFLRSRQGYFKKYPDVFTDPRYLKYMKNGQNKFMGRGGKLLLGASAIGVPLGISSHNRGLRQTEMTANALANQRYMSLMQGMMAPQGSLSSPNMRMIGR